MQLFLNSLLFLGSPTDSGHTLPYHTGSSVGTGNMFRSEGCLHTPVCPSVYQSVRVLPTFRVEKYFMTLNFLHNVADPCMYRCFYVLSLISTLKFRRQYEFQTFSHRRAGFRIRISIGWIRGFCLDPDLVFKFLRILGK